MVHPSPIETDFELPAVDVSPFLHDSSSVEAKKAAHEVAYALKTFGALIIRDPRVTEEHNDHFLDMLEKYFSQTEEMKMKDARPEYAYQVGVTPCFQETPRCSFDASCHAKILELSEDNKPHVPTGPDPKWRYFWRIGDRPGNTKFPELNAEPVIPDAFPMWPEVMNSWGSLLKSTVETVSELAAVGMGMDQEAFTRFTRNGPHLLAPTGSDVGSFKDLETIFAGFHYDLNFLTIHGKSRYPGLLIWTREGRRIQVRVPAGCLLVQAGKQLEYLTGGAIQAGYHEVVVLPDTLKAAEKALQEGRPLWRISSTLFYHVASDQLLQPLPPFVTEQSIAAYPPIATGEQVQQELLSLKLKPF